MNIRKAVFFSGIFYCLSFNTYAGDDYLKSLEAATEAEFNSPAASENPADVDISPEMFTEFENRLKTELRASFHTYRRLNKKHRRNVASYFFNHNKSMDNITIKLLEQYSLQVKNE